MESLTEGAADSVTKVCRDGNVTETVVTAVAEAKGVDPLDLEPLYSFVDPDALNALFRVPVGSVPSDIELRFPMQDCQVIVRGDGEVTVTPEAERGETQTAVAPTER